MIRITIRHIIVNKLRRQCKFAVAAAAEVEGPEGTTAPKTVDPLEFVVFKTDELVLQTQLHIYKSEFDLSH